jgi:hypothetical protein
MNATLIERHLFDDDEIVAFRVFDAALEVRRQEKCPASFSFRFAAVWIFTRLM